MKKSIMTLLAGWLPPFFFESFAIGTVFSAVSSISKWSLITVVDLRLLLIIRRVTASWETAAAWFFKSKSWNLTLKSLKICSSNPKFFRSLTSNPMYLPSISWQLTAPRAGSPLPPPLYFPCKGHQLCDCVHSTFRVRTTCSNTPAGTALSLFS